MGEKPEKQNIDVPQIILEEMKTSIQMSSSPSSPTGLRKSSMSAKHNCLCSPTTHAGSFRCRYHRIHSSMSVGSKLSELASLGSQLPDFDSKPSKVCDHLHAH